MILLFIGIVYLTSKHDFFANLFVFWLFGGIFAALLIQDFTTGKLIKTEEYKLFSLNPEIYLTIDRNDLGSFNYVLTDVEKIKTSVKFYITINIIDPKETPMVKIDTLEKDSNWMLFSTQSLHYTISIPESKIKHIY